MSAEVSALLAGATHAVQEVEANARALFSSAPAEREREGQAHALTFTGSATEFFRIWVVNVFLTLLTLGIYAAWAKVRTERYFYANTYVAGHAFSFLARPTALLKGNLIVAVGLVLFFFSDYLAELPGALAILGAAALYGFTFSIPYLIYKALRFRAQESVYRNIRFGFRGTAGGSYEVYLWVNLLLPFTLGLAYPYIVSLRKGYFYDNLAFGKTRSFFSGESVRFYNFYLPVFAVGAALFVALLFPPTKVVDLSSSFLGEFGDVAFALLGLSVTRQYLYARVTNYCLEHTVFGLSESQAGFRSGLRARDLIFIHLSNLAAIILSLGLLIPWARVRRTRYMLSKIEVICDDPDAFTAGNGVGDGAVGEAAADFLDLDIGL